MTKLLLTVLLFAVVLMCDAEAEKKKRKGGSGKFTLFDNELEGLYPM